MKLSTVINLKKSVALFMMDKIFNMNTIKRI